jgi:uncharacterized protein (TIGR03086 family)
MEPIEQLSQIIPKLTATVDRIQTMQMNDPTPCSNFTVHDVLNHMMVGGATFAYVFRGEQPPELTAPAVYGWVPTAEFHEAMNDLQNAVESPGAMERVVTTPFGEMPGDTFARLVAFDGLIHSWDLASSTGQTIEYPAALIAAVDEFARNALSPDMRDGDTFKDATNAPEGASDLERLVAFSGRTV